MKFNKMVAVIAIFSMAATAYAQTESEPTQGVVILNSNTNTNSNQATAQPVTVVEATPVSDSKADLMRKARQSAEMQTEQKIVEKLEESRLKEEQQRAERLFGNKLDTPAEQPAPVVAPAPVPVAPAPVPVVAEPKEVVPTQVTIEKVEIIQPKEDKVLEEKPEAVSSLKLEEPKDETEKDKLFVGGILAAPSYSASNVKSNYGLGVSVGMNFVSNLVVEGTFLYSNHTVDTYWQAPLYRDLDQYDFSVAAKYYILSGKLKPYAGASLTYIYRKYQERMSNSGWGWNNPNYIVNPDATEEDSNSFNGGLMVGADYLISDKILIGGGLDWNFNLVNRQDFQAQYGLGSGFKPLEEIDYTVIKINAKMTF